MCHVAAISPFSILSWGSDLVSTFYTEGNNLVSGHHRKEVLSCAGIHYRPSLVHSQACIYGGGGAGWGGAPHKSSSPPTKHTPSLPSR